VEVDELTFDFFSREACWIGVMLLFGTCLFSWSACSLFVLCMVDIPNAWCNFESTLFVELREFSELLGLSPAEKKETWMLVCCLD
jgi:hypothetical protein